MKIDQKLTCLKRCLLLSALIFLLLCGSLAAAKTPDFLLEGNVMADSISDQYSQDAFRAKLVDEQIKLGNTEAARAVATKIMESRKRSTAEIAIIVASAPFAAADAFSAISRAANESPDRMVEDRRNWGLSLLAKKLAADGKDTQARQICEYISSPDWYASAIEDVAGAIAAHGDVKGANALISTLPGRRDRLAGYCVIAESLADVGNANAAKDACATIKEFAGHDAESSAHDEWRISIAQAQATIRDWTAASATITSIKHVSERDFAYSTIGDQAARRNDIDGALQMADAIGNRLSKGWLYGVIAAAQYRLGQSAAAAKTLNDAEAIAKDTSSNVMRDEPATTQYFARPNKDREVSNIYASIAVARAESADVDGVKNAIEKIRVGYMRTAVYRNVATALIERDHIKAADQLYQSLTDPQMKCWFLLGEGSVPAAPATSGKK